MDVPGDGDCLFHALAHHAADDGAALRIEVANFMDEQAMNEDDFEGLWLEEAENLQKGSWGGDTAATAYSLLKGVKVHIHIRQSSGAIRVKDATHPDVAKSEDAPLQQVLYNGIDHYQALVALDQNTTGWEREPAQNQLTPVTYFRERRTQPSVAAEEFRPLGSNGNQAPTPGRFMQSRPERKGAKGKKAAKDPKKKTGGAAPMDDSEAPEATPGAALPRRRRYVTKTTPPPELQDDILADLWYIPLRAQTRHPHRKQEDLIKDASGIARSSNLILSQEESIVVTCENGKTFCVRRASIVLIPVAQELAQSKLRQYPTLPRDDKVDAITQGELWPRQFCAFVGCPWVDQDGDENALHAHLHAEHAVDLAPIAACTLRGGAPDAFLGIYNEAIAVKCRSQAPLAGPSVDRRALRSFARACTKDNVEALVCCTCACIYTHVRELAAEGKADIWWSRLLQRHPDTGELTFLDTRRPVAEIANLLALDVFLERYDRVSEEGCRLTDHENFNAWSFTLPGAAGTAPRKILCCPEDGVSGRLAGHMGGLG